jgi:hypothetical protein
MNPPDQTSPAEQRDPPKISAPATLRLSETEPAVVVGTCQELDRMLHRTQLHCTPKHPIVVTLYVHGHRLEIGLGLPKSFVSIQRCEPTPGPNFISIGDARADWGAAFFFHGWHRTEVPERNLLPATKARQILREYFETGLRSTHIEWETL